MQKILVFITVLSALGYLFYRLYLVIKSKNSCNGCAGGCNIAKTSNSSKTQFRFIKY